MSHALGWVAGVVVAAVGVGVPVWWLTARGPEPEAAVVPALDAPADEPPKKTEFGTGGAKAADVAEIKFDGARAAKYVKRFCDIGPRVSGTANIKKQQELMEEHFKKLGATVTRQEFKAKQRSRKEETPFANFVISWHPAKERRILLCTHYDTRPVADQEANPANWNKPFLSANDGTSGVAFLMELGHHMKDLKTEFGIDFVLFDGEEYVFETDRALGGDRYFIGSEHFADEYIKARGTRKHRYDAGVLFDLTFAKGASLPVELHSFEFAKPVVDQIYGVAKAVGARSFKYERGHEVLDDHIALNKVGIPTVDLIDFDYPHWHKLSDTPDKIDAGQMEEVAKVITTWLQKIK